MNRFGVKLILSIVSFLAVNIWLIGKGVAKGAADFFISATVEETILFIILQLLVVLIYFIYPLTVKKYKIIYADPPWNYKVYSKKGLGRSAESHYPTMSIEDICALPVGNLADKDCALFLWVTIPCLLEGLSVLKAWGFTYKTVGFVWVKQNRKADSLFWGMGYWTRSNVELCILATKGHPKRINAAVHQVIVSHIEEHSKKPQEARERIVSLMGDLPRIELFARQSTPGWDVWGNEVDSSISFP